MNSGATLRTTSTAASSGTASFASIVYTTASTQASETVYYGASTSGLMVACSTGFANTNIVPAAANKLAYTTQPATNASTAAGSAFTTQPAIQIQDIYSKPAHGGHHEASP